MAGVVRAWQAARERTIGLVVGSLDNVLRPMLVGKDTKMHELMIFFSTLGGILGGGLDIFLDVIG